ncbi:MAG: hypothetical protein JSV45_11825 [Chromatiales bacterium]|nr:MAG: hypothetical protein JSV45_11825 [Chromatiales bacterium]
MADASAGLSSLQFSILTVCGVLALLLVAANVGLSLNNRVAQEEVNTRQQYINQTVQVSRLNNQIAEALATLSAQTGDESIRQLLAANGITFTAQEEPEAAQ